MLMPLFTGKYGNKRKKEKEKKKKIKLPPIPGPEGFYRKMTVFPGSPTGPHKFTLNFLETGHAVMIIDGKYKMYLNPTAAVFTVMLLEGHTPEDIAGAFPSVYRVKYDTVLADCRKVAGLIEGILSGDTGIGFDGKFLSPIPSGIDTGIPERVDFAVTYRCNNACKHCYIPSDWLNLYPHEADTRKILEVADKIAGLGIPHVALTGGEATLRSDLPEIISFLAEKGTVVGVITNGRRFADETFAEKCIKSGMDYVQITLESHIPKVHDSMQNVTGAWEETVKALRYFIGHGGIDVMTNTTITSYNAPQLPDFLRFLYKEGVKVFAANTLIRSGKGKEYPDALPPDKLISLLKYIRDFAAEHNMRFIWYSPTPYCILNPLELGLGPKRCSAAHGSIGIDPNGDCRPCQSYFTVVGNILKDPWDKIWYHPLFVTLRDREYVTNKCLNCELFDICGGGCPLEIRSVNE